MCGIVGLVYSDSNAHVNQALVDALTILQHRGQDAAGIVTANNGRLNLRKDTGTVSDVFTQDSVINLLGNIGIGHVRYPTAGNGGSCTAEAQPLYTNSPFGIAIAHNGNLVNTNELIASMRSAQRHINTDSDSELLLNVFADELQKKLPHQMVTHEDVFDAVRVVMRRCKGAYAVVILINHIGILAFRDPNGIRPLCFGKKQTSSGTDYAVASESVAIDALDPKFILERDVTAGEAILISNGGQFYSQVTHPPTKFTPCLFEYVYFARPDSILEGVQVYEARSRMGEKLANKIVRLMPDHDIDSIIPIPETSRTAALACAAILNRPYREGFIKNRYIARTFIMPGQEMRRKTVRLKLNSIKSEFKDKVVLLVDDSIVRGTTSIELIQMARDAGAKKVYFASAAPPVRYSNVYGIDIPTKTELVAHNRTEAEICQLLEADAVFYNDLDDVLDAVSSLNPSILQAFDASCFDGKYVTKEVTKDYLDDLESSRGAGRNGVAPTKVNLSTSKTPLASPTASESNERQNSTHNSLFANSFFSDPTTVKLKIPNPKHSTPSLDMLYRLGINQDSDLTETLVKSDKMEGLLDNYQDQQFMIETRSEHSSSKIHGFLSKTPSPAPSEKYSGFCEGLHNSIK